MARIRYLKPDFFTNEELGALSPYHRLAFAGLWCQADKAGRMKDRPMKLKLAILPYDDVDFDLILTELHKMGFITRYKTDEEQLIQVNNFKTHQRLHHLEPESSLPQPIKLTTCKGVNKPSTAGEQAVHLSRSLSLSNSPSYSKKEEPTGNQETLFVEQKGECEGGGAIERIFLAYCESWERNPKTYKLTPQRRQWIRAAIESYGEEGAQRGIRQFRNDEFENRARFNGLEYLFGKRERIDKWCAEKIYSRVFSREQTAHRDGIEKLELAKQLGREMEAKRNGTNNNGTGTDHGNSVSNNRTDERREANSEGPSAPRRHAGA